MSENALREALEACVQDLEDWDASYPDRVETASVLAQARAALAAEAEGEVAGYVTLESGEIRTSTVKGQPTGTFELHRIPQEASTERCGGSREIWLGAYPAGGEIHEATTPCPGCPDCTGGEDG